MTRNVAKDGRKPFVPDLETLRLAREAGSNREAAERVLARLIPRVRKAVYVLAGADSEVQDLVCICLEEILKSLRRYKGTGSLEAWAGRVTFRVVMRQMKRKRRRERVLYLDPEANGRSASNPDREASMKRLRRALARHLGRLPPERRETLMLRVVLGHSVAEVAELTGAPINTVRDRIRVALRELRTSLSKDREAIELYRGVD